MTNRLMLSGIGRGLTWMCVGTLVTTVRFGGLRWQHAAPTIGTFLCVLGMLLILSHRPSRGLARLALWCLVADLLAGAAVLAAGWPGMERWLTVIPGPVAGAMGGVLMLRCARIVAREGLLDSGGRIQIIGWVWTTVYGLIAAAVAGLVLVRSEQGRALAVSEGIGCATFALFALPSILGLAVSRNLLDVLKGRSAKCQNCGFSLAGLRGSVCPECGLQFKGEAPAAEEPPAQAEPITAWAWLLGVVIFAMGGATYFQAPGNGLEEHKPYWMLRRDIDAAQASSESMLIPSPATALKRPTPGASRAMDELTRRVQNGSLRPEQRHELAERVLKAQQDQTVSFDDWTALIESLLTASALTPEQRERFTTQSLQFIFQVSPRVKVGQPIAVRLRALARPSIGTFAPQSNSLAVTETLVTIGGRTFTLKQAQSSSNSQGVFTWSYESEALAGAIEAPRAPMTPGKHRVEAVIQLEQWDRRAGLYPSQQRTFSADVEVVDQNATPSFQTTAIPKIGKDIDRVLAARVSPHPRGGGGTILFSVPILQSWQCDVVADVIAEVDGIEAVMGPVLLRKDFPYARVEVTPYVMGILSKAPGVVTVRLRPNLEAAWTAIDVTTVWAGDEIVVAATLPQTYERVHPSRSTIQPNKPDPP